MSSPQANSIYSSTSGTTSTDVFIAVLSSVNPSGSDINYPVQKRWVNTTTKEEFILVGYTSFNGQIQANWLLLGAAGTVALQTLKGNTGGLVPGDSSENINVVGDGTTCTVVGNPGAHSLTISALNGFTGINTQSFSANGTYTPSPNTTVAVVYLTGGGGGGGNADGASAPGAGGGGAAGETRIGVFSAAALASAAPINVVIGTGGTSATNGLQSRFGALMIAGPGQAGQNWNGVSGDGGMVLYNSGLGGNINIFWGNGGKDSRGIASYVGGEGGDSYYGSGGKGGTVASSGAILAANGQPGFRGGGGGGGVISDISVQAVGGVGGDGFCYIYEYLG